METKCGKEQKLMIDLICIPRSRRIIVFDGKLQQNIVRKRNKMYQNGAKLNDEYFDDIRDELDGAMAYMCYRHAKCKSRKYARRGAIAGQIRIESHVHSRRVKGLMNCWRGLCLTFFRI